MREKKREDGYGFETAVDRGQGGTTVCRIYVFQITKQIFNNVQRACAVTTL